jgi:glyoxylase-like metal-dependent hydrolase (beta-lactamase superfamily II)
VEFLKGVHVFETYASTTLLLDDRLVLIDTSGEADAKGVLNGLAKANVTPRDLGTIFITHTHPDHVGGLATIKNASPAKVAAHRIEADFISRRKVYDGPPGVQRHPGTPVDVLLEDGQTHDGLQVIFGPGHTRGSIALLDESRSLLIAGDTMRNEGSLGPMDDKYNVDPKAHRESIKKIARFSFENLIVGHGAPIRGGASGKVAALAERL